MSDKSSESSSSIGEWVVLNEEEVLSAENNEQSLNLELNYDAVCDAVSDSIKSSLSSEELEWQYEQFDDYIPPHRHFHVEELDLRESDVECESEDSNVEDDFINKCDSSSVAEEEVDLNLAAVSKIQSYKHNRNDHVNFVLNLMLALAIASAVGLGIGHFIGWSHKCLTRTSVSKAADSVNVPDTVSVQQVPEIGVEKQTNPSIFSGSLSDSVSCSLKNGKHSSNEEVCSKPENPVTDIALSKTPIFSHSDVIEIKTTEKISQNGSSDSLILGVPHASNVGTHFIWNEISDVEASMKSSYDLKKLSLSNVDYDFRYKNDVDYIEFKSPKIHYPKERIAEGKKEFHNSETEAPVNEKDNLSDRKSLNRDEPEFLKQFLNAKEDSFKESNLTNQLRKDLNEVIQSATAIALARLADFNTKSALDEPSLVMDLYADFQNLVDTKLTHVDNFILSTQYKKDKLSLKYLEKMVYSIVDAVDHLMRVSFKTLGRDDKKINAYKLLNDLSKVVFNFNKKWEKINRSWSETTKKSKFRGSHKGYIIKENKQGEKRKRFQADKLNYKNPKYRKFSMKS